MTVEINWSEVFPPIGVGVLFKSPLFSFYDFLLFFSFLFFKEKQMHCMFMNVLYVFFCSIYIHMYSSFLPNNFSFNLYRIGYQ